MINPESRIRMIPKSQLSQKKSRTSVQKFKRTVRFMIAFNLWAPDFDCFRSDLSRHLDLEFSKFHDIFMVLHNLLRCMIWYNLTLTFLDS